MSVDIIPDNSTVIRSDQGEHTGIAFVWALLLEGIILALFAWLVVRSESVPPVSSSDAVQLQIVAAATPPTPVKPVVEPPPKLPKPVAHPVKLAQPKPLPPPPLPVSQQLAPLPSAATPSAMTEPPPPPPVPVQQVAAEPSAAAKENYFAEVRSAIQAAEQFPDDARLLRQQGQVEVRFQLDNGQISNLSIITPGTLATFNSNALNAVRNAALPPPPKAMIDKSYTLTLWVKFTLKTL